MSWQFTAHLIQEPCNFFGVVSSEQRKFDCNPWRNTMTNCWGIDDQRNTIYRENTHEEIEWEKPALPMRKEFTLRFTADYTQSAMRITIWYKEEKLNKQQGGYTLILPELDEAHEWYPCATPYNKDAWVRIQYL